MKAVITNNTKQNAEVHYWRSSRLDHWTVPFGTSLEVDVPSAEGDDQKAHIAEQCKALGLSFREGTL